MASGYETDRDYYQREDANRIAASQAKATARRASAETRTADALERIADALERLSGPTSEGEESDA